MLLLAVMAVMAVMALAETSPVWHVRLVDKGVYGNLLFRGGAPEAPYSNDTAAFSYDGLVASLRQAHPLPNNFSLVVIDLEALAYQPSGASCPQTPAHFSVSARKTPAHFSVSLLSLTCVGRKQLGRVARHQRAQLLRRQPRQGLVSLVADGGRADRSAGQCL